MDKPLFKAGDKAMRVHIPHWGGARSFVTVEIGKVHKTGRLTLLNDKQQWSHTLGFNGEPDYFTETGGGKWSLNGTRLYPFCEHMAKEIRAEQEAAKTLQNVRWVGEALGRLRNRDKAAKLWATMPDDLKALIDQEKG